MAIERGTNLPAYFSHVLLYENADIPYILCYNQGRKTIDCIQIETWTYAGAIDLKKLKGYNADLAILSLNIQGNQLIILQEINLYIIQLDGLDAQLTDKYEINNENRAFYKDYTIYGDIHFKPLLNTDGSVYLMNTRYDVAVNNPEYYKGNNEVRLYPDTDNWRAEFAPVTYPENYTRGYYGYYFLPQREVNSRGEHVFSYAMSPQINTWDPSSGAHYSYEVQSAYQQRAALPLNPSAIQDNAALMKFTIEAPVYTSLKYDPYRDIYYRFFRPEIVEGADCNSCTYRDKPLVIMILDKRFNVLDELYLQNSIYEEQTSFVGPEGLYLSCAAVNNPNFGSNYISYDILKVHPEVKSGERTDSALRLVPSSDAGFYITGTFNDGAGAVVTIFDLNGKIVYRDIYYENAIISLTQVPAGIYMIQIANNREAVVLKWIKG